MRIKRLPKDLANQIAAGEVVERPASVVKELVENALDAGATRIAVEIEQGGTTRIVVSDDGEGMDPADARLAVERHATSKIARIEDLTEIGTFGFRGEALPSIASVARFSLRTRTRAQSEGVEVRVEGGGAVDVRPAGTAPGTTIEVSDLFFNVPARRKFLKSVQTESAHVGEVVLLAALARPEVTFTLSRDGRVAREYLRVATRRERVVAALAEKRLEACGGERGPLHIEAHLTPPERARSGAGALHVFVNGRPVKDRPLARAVAQAYGSVLEPGRYPVGVLYIDIPPALVDVNVHPQKAEVRFADARALFDAVTRELYASTSRVFAIPALGPSSRPWLPPPRTSHGAPSSNFVNAPTAPPPHGPTESVPGAPPRPADGSHGFVSALDRGTLAPPTLRTDRAPAAVDPHVQSTQDRPVEAEGALFPETGFYGALRFLAQLRATFLLCEGEDGLYVLDQHAAAERVTFDRLRKGFAARGVAMQKLLVPERVEIGAREVALLEEAASEISSLGVEVRALGTSAVAVHGVPKILARANPERLVRDLAAELLREAGRPFGGAVDLVLATMACHGSVRAGDVLTTAEAEALLRSLDGIDFSGHCPHGRPVVTRLAFGELERRVGR